ncbi:hypothetical protein [Pedobacter chitinilyticus]|uniref:Uncharacterized protein n=1 Tax=Pedobacter chitinilyticus TaxID=2233776 RepID=A0A443YW10_9SPHI|nr:hypothetical protein [Pedobacter chitinilyticus]RWU08156.1 hypothetical protein DPV69_07180 [Pedobacter chitinilyticus]
MYRYILIFSVNLLACNCNKEGEEQIAAAQGEIASVAMIDPVFIPVDTAAMMISSYVTSLAGDSTVKLRSWSIDANALRSYLQDNSITDVSISLSHTPGYIRAGHYGVFAGFDPNALTVILSGKNAAGATVVYQGSYLLDRAKPCPPNCPSASTSNP